MRRGIAWIIMGLVVIVILVSAYALIGVLRESAEGGTPTPTQTLSSEVATTLTPVLAPTATNTPLPISTDTHVPSTSTPTLLPTSTPTPIPPTPTPSVTPYVISGGDYPVNVRLEPGTGDVPVIGSLRVDQELAIVGKNPDGSWWQVCCVNEQVGWVYAEVVEAIGPLDGVPVAPEFGGTSTSTPTVPAADTPTTPPDTDTPTPSPTATPMATIAVATPTSTPKVSNFGQIRGVVYWDRNGNGALDEGESAIDGALISIYRLPEMAPVGNEITGEDGVFLFGDLEPGGYTLFETAPAGFAVEPTDSVVTVTVEAGQVSEVAFRNSPLE